MAADLVSRRDARAKSAIAGFVWLVTQQGDSFVPAAGRIATIDEGTPRAEQLAPPQVDLVFKAAKAQRALPEAALPAQHSIASRTASRWTRPMDGCLTPRSPLR